MLDPVVVTGSREPGASGGLPFSVSSVDAALLEDAGPGFSVAEALARVAGVGAQSRSNYAQDVQLHVRGFGARAGFGVRGLRLYTDGIPAAAPDGQGQLAHFNLASAGRIEVLRGPFSALYGSSSGGVIALHSAAPAGDSAALTSHAGSFGARQQRLRLGGRLGRVALGGDAGRLDIDGFRPHSSARRTLAFARGEWQGGDDRVVVTASHWDQPALDPLGLTRAQFEQNPRQVAPQAQAFNTRKDARQAQAGAHWRRGTGGGPALELAAWGGERAVTQWLAIPVAPQADPDHAGGVVDLDRGTAGADARGVWPLGALELIGGVAGEWQDEERRGYENFSGGGAQLGVTGALRRDETNRLGSFDQYLQGQWAFAPRWSALAGVRRGEVRVRSTDRYLANGDDSGARRFRFVNPVAGVRVAVAPGLSAYASAGRGFETPTLNELAYRSDGSAGLNQDLRAQASRQYEAGLKLREDGQRVDLALFRADTDGELTPRTNAGGRATFQNGAASRRFGAEAEWRAQHGPWEAQAALTWLEARYREGFLTCGPPPCTDPDVPVAAGNRLPAVARYAGFFGLARQWRGVEAGAEARAASRRAVNDANSEFAAGYAVFALRVEKRWEVPRGALRLGARVDNLLDRVHAPSVIVNEGNGRYYEPGAPRAFLLTLAAEVRR